MLENLTTTDILLIFGILILVWYFFTFLKMMAKTYEANTKALNVIARSIGDNKAKTEDKIDQLNDSIIKSGVSINKKIEWATNSILRNKIL